MEGHSDPDSPEQILQPIFLKVGQLNYTWTNTESLLIHLIAGLAGTTKEVATVIFLTLNTTRARIDLVERLVKIGSLKDRQGQVIIDTMRALAREGGVRNRLNHCIYSFDPESGEFSTILMRIQDRKTEIRMGKEQKLNADEMARLDRTISRLQELNREIWQIVKENGFPF